LLPLPASRPGLSNVSKMFGPGDLHATVGFGLMVIVEVIVVALLGIVVTTCVA